MTSRHNISHLAALVLALLTWATPASAQQRPPLTAAPALSVQEPDEWIKYTSPEGRYIVLLPGQPTVSTKAASAGGANFTQYKAAVIDSAVGYMIGYFDYTETMNFSLDGARDGMIEAVKGTLLAENSISLGGYPGRELRILAKDTGGTEYLTHARYYDINRRVYVVQFIIPKSAEAESAAKASKYFDSFQVVKD